MCGRFGMVATPDVVASHLSVRQDSLPTFTPCFNIAPTMKTPVVRHDRDGQRRVHNLAWGLIPSWSEDAKGASRLINARAQSAHIKPSFRQAFGRRRCLVLADGIYEWKRIDGGKQAHHIGLNDDTMFAMAGLWERWRPSDSEPSVDTFTIVTTTANAALADLHHRMPVIISPQEYDIWLDRNTPLVDIKRLLKPYPSGEMTHWPVSDLVNRVANDNAKCRLSVS